MPFMFCHRNICMLLSEKGIMENSVYVKHQNQLKLEVYEKFRIKDPIHSP